MRGTYPFNIHRRGFTKRGGRTRGDNSGKIGSRVGRTIEIAGNNKGNSETTIRMREKKGEGTWMSGRKLQGPANCQAGKGNGYYPGNRERGPLLGVGRGKAPS